MEENSKGIRKMLRWKLRLVMAEKNISGKELAELSGLPAPSISRLRVLDHVGQISSNTLDSLCIGLTKAYRARGDMRTITPNDLLEFTFDGNGDDPSAKVKLDPTPEIGESSTPTQKTTKTKRTTATRRTKPSTPGNVIEFPGIKQVEVG